MIGHTYMVMVKLHFLSIHWTEIKEIFLLECVKHAVKFPDGYDSDLDSCVDIENNKLSSIKSHDCYIFMDSLLPFIFSELLDQNIHLALSCANFLL